MIRAPLPAVALALALALGGCGQKGPLKLPEPAKPADPPTSLPGKAPEPIEPATPK